MEAQMHNYQVLAVSIFINIVIALLCKLTQLAPTPALQYFF